MSSYPLVSVITPCFNGESYIDRLLDSILSQTYPNIEMIVINDGSTDKTEEIVKSYKQKFIDQNMKLIYLYQKNSGQAEAINHGLQYFTGEYLTWPDSDDFLDATSIEKRVQFLENNPLYGFVRSDANLIAETNLTVALGKISDNRTIKEDVFLDLITEKTYLSSGTYLLRTKAFLDVNREKYIYNSRAGQNWQMILPVAYRYKCGFINEPLYNIVIRANSHSRDITKLSQQYQRACDHEDILKHTVNSIKMEEDEKLKYLSLIDRKYTLKRYMIGIKSKKKRDYEYHIMKEKGYLNYKYKMFYWVYKLNIAPLYLRIKQCFNK